PYWTDAGDRNADILSVIDLRNSTDWRAAARQQMARFLAEPMDVERVAPVRIKYYKGPSGEGQIALRWSHALTDGEGAQWFLAEVARCDSESIPPPDLLTDGRHLDPLADRGLLRRLGLFASGFRHHREHAGVPQTTLGDPRAADSADLRIHYRLFDAAE